MEVLWVFPQQVMFALNCHLWQLLFLSQNCQLPRPHQENFGKVTGITHCEVLIATSSCAGPWNKLQLSKIVHSLPTPGPIQLFGFPRLGTPPHRLPVASLPSESCKWGCHILWLRMLYCIENYFKNCKQRAGLCLHLTSKPVTLPFLTGNLLMWREAGTCAGGSCMTEPEKSRHICRQRHEPLLRGCGPQGLPIWHSS